MTKRGRTKQDSKVAIVTGGSRGIGLEVAKGLAQDGFSLVLVARSKAGLQRALPDIDDATASTTRRHTIHAVDVANADEVRAVVDQTKQQYGRIDLLVNNAGIYQPGTLDVPVEEFERGLRVNLLAPFAFMQAVLPVMKAQRTGYIVNIASRAGKIGFEGEGVYCAGKFALVGLSESVYRELANDCVKVTTLCPGWVNTEMAQEAGTPLSAGDMIQPADILQTIRWLLSLTPATCVREVVIECLKSIR